MYYGWWVVLGCFIAQMFLVGFYSYSASLLIQPVRDSFGASVEQVMYSMTMATFVGLLTAPLGGMLIDKLSVRGLMTFGIAVFAFGLWGLAQSTSIEEYVLIFGIVIALGNALAGSMSSSAVVSRWFSANRGKALGISSIGTSVGGILVPAMLAWWLTEHSWRESLEFFALVVAVVAIPAVWLTVRHNPEDMSHPELANVQSGAQTAPTAVLSLSQILRNPAYWMIGLSLGLLFSTYTAILSNITPYVMTLGHGEGIASTLIMLVAASGFVGKLIFGMAADKFSLKAGLWVAQVLVILGFVLLSLEPSYPLMLLASVLMGLAAGGMLPVWSSMVAQVFGLLSYGRAMGLMSPLITLCVMPSFPIAGRLYDSTGSYALCLVVFSVVVLLGALLLLPLRLNTTQNVSPA